MLLNPYRFGVASIPSVLLLHMDGTDASTTFTDEYGHTVTANGNAQIDTASSKFGGASGLFDGTGDYLTIPDSTDWDFGTADFTIECQVNAAASGYSGLVGMRDTGSVNPILYLWTTGVIVWYYNGAARITGTTNISGGGWYHIALVRYGGSTKIYVNGTQEGSTYTDSNNYVADGIWIGGTPSASQYLNGHMDEVRITKGTARYTGNFTAPSAAFTE